MYCSFQLYSVKYINLVNTTEVQLIAAVPSKALHTIQYIVHTTNTRYALHTEHSTLHTAIKSPLPLLTAWESCNAFSTEPILDGLFRDPA